MYGGKVGVVTGLEIAAITLESQKRPTDQKINPPVDRMEPDHPQNRLAALTRVEPLRSRLFPLSLRTSLTPRGAFFDTAVTESLARPSKTLQRRFWEWSAWFKVTTRWMSPPACVFWIRALRKGGTVKLTRF